MGNDRLSVGSRICGSAEPVYGLWASAIPSTLKPPARRLAYRSRRFLMLTIALRSSRHLLPALCLGLVLFGLQTLPALAADHSLGVGAQFFRTVDSFTDDIFDDSFNDVEDDGYALVLSYQYVPKGLLRFELDLEYYEDGFGGAGETAFTPIGYVLLGRSWYVGVGLGVTYSDGLADDVSDPFYAARIGWRFDLLPKISLDLNANYRADAFNDLDQADTDAITLGAILRFDI